MMYVRGCPEDYDSWAAAARDDVWKYRNVLPYFIKSERLENEHILRPPDGIYHGTGGFSGVTGENRKETVRYLQAFRGTGNVIVSDVNGRNSVGYALPLYTIANGIRQPTAYTNLAANRGRPNLHVLKNTFVFEILFDDDNSAIGVRAITEDNRVLSILAGKEVIISAGAFNSAKLLMLSGVGPKEHVQSMNIKVKNDLPVGRNLRDHVVVMLSFKMERSRAPLVPNKPGQLPFPVVVGYASLNKSQPCAQYQVINFIIPNDSEGPYRMCTFNFGFKESICRNIFEAGKSRRTLLAFLSILHPKCRGGVMLRGKNPYDLPIIYTESLSQGKDLEDLTTYLQDYTRVINTTYFINVKAEIVDLNLDRCKGFQFGSREYWKCYGLYVSTTMFHYAGTCAMGSVVDSRLRAFNTGRLRVADASVMPKLTSGNTNAPAIMIGEKVSDMIKEEHRHHLFSRT